MTASQRVLWLAVFLPYFCDDLNLKRKGAEGAEEILRPVKKEFES